MTAASQPEFIAALMQPGILADAGEPVELIETHISWVLLAGNWAYKIKKPLDLGFLDFSTLEKRRAACEAELRLNQRLAPRLYEAVVAITGAAHSPRVEGKGVPLDYAVKMRRFPQSQLLDRLQENGQLTAALIDTVTDEIARFHQQLEPAPTDSHYGTPEQIWAPVEQNFLQIDGTPLAMPQRERLERLRDWSGREHTTKHDLFSRRRAEGHIRECHGDLHLGNIVALEQTVVPFDCLEFNPDLRWIDTLSEIAFLIMDLDDRGETSLAHRCLNRYLEVTGDYRGMAVLPFYLVYRALVRAKVNAIRSGQPGVSRDERQAALSAGARYLELASRYIEPAAPHLYLTHGLSGSGKTTLTQELLEKGGMVRIRSDVERKRLSGLAQEASSRSALGAGLYSRDTTERTYLELENLAAALLTAGWSVIVDATFLRVDQRTPFFELARCLKVPITLFHFTAPVDVLEGRIKRRLRDATDASEATLEVLHHQIAQRESLTAPEQSCAVVIDTRDPASMAQWMTRSFPGDS